MKKITALLVGLALASITTIFVDAQTIGPSPGGGGGTPGGSNTQCQYNNAGAFGGITGCTTDGTAVTLVAPVLGTPASGTLTHATGLPVSTGVSGLGTGVATALGVNVGSAGAFVTFNGALGTPSSGTLTNATGLPLTTGVTGVLPVANGGTNCSTASMTCFANITGTTISTYAGATTNSGNTYTIASPTPTGFTFTDQYTICFSVNATNTGAATLNANFTGAKAIDKQSASGSLIALVGGEMVGGTEQCASVNSSANAYVLTSYVPANSLVLTSNKTATAADWAAWSNYTFTAASLTLTLPQSTTLATNGGLLDYAAGNSQTLTPNASDQVCSPSCGSAGTGITINAGDFAFISADGVSKVYAFTAISPSSTDTLTNKTFDTGGTGNVFKIAGTAITAISGNTATLASESGTLTSGNCIKSDANHNLVDSGGTCGGGGGTPGGSNTQVQYNNSSAFGGIAGFTSDGTNVTVASANLTYSGNQTAASWTTTGIGEIHAAATFTNSSTASSGTAATAYVTTFAQPTIAASNTSVTTTHTCTVCIRNAPAAGTNETLTAKSALYLESGDLYMGTSGQNIKMFNVGTPGATNTEDVFMSWVGNVFEIVPEKSGTGTVRGMLFGTGTSGAGNGSSLTLAGGSSDSTLLTNGQLILNSGSGSPVVIETAGTVDFTMGSSITSFTTGGPQINGAAASATVPTLIPNKGSSTTGVGAQASGNMSAIVSGAEKTRWTSNGMEEIAGAITGGTAASSALTIESTSGAGTTDAIIFKVASQSESFRINTSGHLVDATAGSWQIMNQAASSTAPTFVPNKADTTTGVGSQASGNMSLIAGATEIVRMTSTSFNLPGLTQSSAAQSGTMCYNSTAPGQVTYDATLGCLSSLEELKDNHGPITAALAEVMKLKPFWASWKPTTVQFKTDKHTFPALGAHQVEKIDSRLTGYGPDGKLRGVRYANAVALLVAAVQEQQGEISDLKSRVSKLEHANDNLRKALAK